MSELASALDPPQPATYIPWDLAYTDASVVKLDNGNATGQRGADGKTQGVGAGVFVPAQPGGGARDRDIAIDPKDVDQPENDTINRAELSAILEKGGAGRRLRQHSHA